METTKMIRVNSRFKDKDSNSNGDFIYNMGDLLMINSCLDLTLVSARIPRLYGNIYAPINELSFVDSFGEETTVYASPGQYTATQLAAEISARCVDISVTTSYNTDLHRFIFTARDRPQKMLASSSMAAYIGLLEDIVLGPTPFQIDYGPTLDGPACVYIQSSQLSRGSTCGDCKELGSYIPLVCCVPADVPYGYTVSYEAKDIQAQMVSYRSSKNYPNLSNFDIQVCDQFGNVLNFPHNAYIDLLFRVSLLV